MLTHLLAYSLNHLLAHLLAHSITYLLAHLLTGLGVVVSQELAVEYSNDYEPARGKTLFWTVSMDTLTRVHQSIFNNLRKYEGKPSFLTSRGSSKQERRSRNQSINKESDSSMGSFWSKAFTFTSSTDSSKERSARAVSEDDDDEQGLYVYNINRTSLYRIIDPTKRPHLNLFDDLVAETEHKMSGFTV